jgi:hypothetical protein
MDVRFHWKAPEDKRGLARLGGAVHQAELPARVAVLGWLAPARDSPPLVWVHLCSPLSTVGTERHRSCQVELR